MTGRRARWHDRDVEVLIEDVGGGRAHVRIGDGKDACTANVPAAELTYPWHCTANGVTAPCGQCTACRDDGNARAVNPDTVDPVNVSPHRLGGP